MTSPDRIAANRRNARHSTGPRTAAGKRKSAANSLRHGVRSSIGADPDMGGAVARITAALAGPDASPDLLALINPIAEAEVDLLRARNARVAIIDLAAATLIADGQPEGDPFLTALPSLQRLDRYERSAMRRRHRALRELRKSYTRMSK